MTTTTITPDLDALRADYLRPYRANTLGLYNFYLDRFLTWCRHNDVHWLRASRRDIERYIDHLLLDEELAAASVCTALTPVRGFYRFAHQECLIDRDPAMFARRPRITSMPKDTVGLDRSQMQAFLAAGQRSGGRYHAAAFLLGCMALRASEACSIRIEDYQRTSRGHRVIEFHGKAGVPARMPVPVPVLRALDAAAADRDSGPLLLRRDGGPLTRQGLGTLVNTLGRRAGISGFVVRPHLLRHSCITNALESGASLRKVQDLARHAEPRTTMRYDRNRTNLDDHAVHTLVAFIAPAESPDVPGVAQVAPQAVSPEGSPGGAREPLNILASDQLNSIVVASGPGEPESRDRLDPSDVEFRGPRWGQFDPWR